VEHLKPPAEINPYASPAGPGGYGLDQDPGVGAWSCDRLLVIHRDAVLPPVCLETGQPATHWRRYGVDWSYLTDLDRRTHYLRLPLCAAAYRRYRQRWWIGCGCALVPIAAIAAIFFWGRQMPLAVIATLCGLSVASGLGLFAIGWLIGVPLRFSRVRDPYLWLEGASLEFLEKLPPWNDVA
jgi:hypothetical protein